MAIPWVSLRCFADRRVGAVKVWNEQKGFGFIAPSEGGEDVFVHRTSVAEGVQLSPGMSVSYLPEWDAKKNKDRASNVQVAEPPEGESSGTGAGEVQSHHIVGSWEKWNIHKAAMKGDDALRHRVTLRSDAAKGKGGDVREEFQIVGNQSWDLRFYPAGGDKEEVVVLKPGGAGSKAALGSKKKGHGRNWAVEGTAGESFDIIFDKQSIMVKSEMVE
ncbi:Cold shock domain-containing protein 4 (AtCSP4) (Glycine-rich protein 2b) (AtGRP2b) [Durusdinium trenchii]|uniref:Cold shock domain-containing protein 4 (AtCSP4) (Glycine-rich protein 2b) (AtGRP2b) n=1 Tax=Durusdinium trenchii TaxID=1381693 RepID=A0ABP0S5X5_9DINO